MRAIVIEKFGGPDCLVYEDLPEPEPVAGQVVIEVKAFGLNHAEMHMRRGEWAEAAPACSATWKSHRARACSSGAGPRRLARPRSSSR